MAEVSATLIGLFLVGVFFYVETGFRQLDDGVREVFVPYMRAGTRIVLALFAIPLFLSLTLVVLGLNWNRVLFAVLSLILVVANVETLVRIRPVVGAQVRTLVANELLGSLLVLVLVVLPWALGGLDPTREDLAWAILLSFAAGLLSVTALILSVFDAST